MLTSKEFRLKYKITQQTLHNWRKSGRVKFTKITSGTFMYYDLEENDSILEIRRNVIYARVSNTKQKEDLERQEQVIRDYMISNGILVDHVYKDI